MNITEEMTIWFPGIYRGREGAYAKTVAETPDQFIIELVQTRAQEDGEWAIETKHVGDNEDLMRKMMDWVSKEENILQALNHILNENMAHERTVDWLCRELANASKWVGGGGARG